MTDSATWHPPIVADEYDRSNSSVLLVLQCQMNDAIVPEI